MNARSVRFGAFGAAGLVVSYALVVGLASGSVDHLADQARQDWYLLVPIIAGFGVQVGLMAELRRRHRLHRAAMAAGGTGTAGSLEFRATATTRRSWNASRRDRRCRPGPGRRGLRERQRDDPRPRLRWRPGPWRRERSPSRSTRSASMPPAPSSRSHSTPIQKLDFDVARDATLTVAGAPWPGATWSGDGPDGHHRAGTIRFGASGPAQGAVVLSLGGLPAPVTAAWTLGG